MISKYKNIAQSLTKHKLVLSMIGLLVLLICVYFFNLRYTYVTIQFDELRPVQQSMFVYYNGFKIGKVVGMKPSEDYKSTLMTVMLNPDNLKLPTNTTAVVKKEKQGKNDVDVVDLIYPTSPETTYLKDSSIIQGTGRIEIEDQLADLAGGKGLEQIKANLNDTLESVTAAFGMLETLLSSVNDTIVENQPNIKKMTDNFVASSSSLRNSSKNLDEMTKKLNNSLEQTKLDNTISNISESSTTLNETIDNFRSISENINLSTQNLSSTRTNLDTTIKVSTKTIQSAEEIVSGINKTLRKNFGGLRILFGKTIQNETCEK